MSPQQQILARCKEVFKVAQSIYWKGSPLIESFDFNDIDIRFDLRGRSAGQAYRTWNKMGMFVYGLRFNGEMLTRDAFDHILKDTVPHEIAHLICFMNPGLGKNHDKGWQRICRSIGGSAERCHQEQVILGRGNTYEYLTTNGHKVRIGEKHHRIVQGGRPLTFRNNLGTIARSSTYAIVGVSGKPLPTPIIKNHTPTHTKEINVWEIDRVFA